MRLIGRLLWWSGCAVLLPIGSCVWVCNPQVTLLLWEIMEPLGHVASIEDMGTVG